MEYTIKRELVRILGVIELQLGELGKSVKGVQAKVGYFSEDIEKLVSEKYAELTDTQKYSVAETMRIKRISTNC